MLEQEVQGLREDVQRLEAALYQLTQIMQGATVSTGPTPSQQSDLAGHTISQEDMPPQSHGIVQEDMPGPAAAQAAQPQQPAQQPQQPAQQQEPAQPQQPAGTDPWGGWGAPGGAWPEQSAQPQQLAPAQPQQPQQGGDPTQGQHQPEPQPAAQPSEADANGTTLGDVRNVLAQLNRQTGIDLLARYGVERLPDLPVGHYTNILQEASAILSGQQ